MILALGLSLIFKIGSMIQLEDASILEYCFHWNNNCKIKAFSVESKVRNKLRRNIRSISPSSSKLESINREGQSNLYADEDTLEVNFPYASSFQSFNSKPLKPKEQDTFQHNSSKRHRILEQLSQKNGILGVKNPLNYIWSHKKNPSVSKNIELRVSKNKFDFSEQKQLTNDYLFSKKYMEEGLPKIVKDYQKSHSETKIEEEKLSLSFLTKLEDSIRKNRRRALEEDDMISNKRMIYSEFTSPLRSDFDFTFS